MTTDRIEYSPGDTALISGAGWQPSESIALAIECTCGCTDSLLATAGDDGTFGGVEYLIGPEHIGATCTVTAIGAASEQVATTSFTDANISVLPEPTGTSFTLTTTVYSGTSCTGTAGTPIVRTISSSTIVAAATTSQSVRLEAATTADNGSSFSHWTGFLFSSTDSNICVNGPSSSTTYTAHYTSVCAAPTITCPANITRDTTTGTCTASASYSPTVSSACAATVTCTPKSPGTFGLGTSTVTCTATNSGGSRSCSFTVTVNDAEAPAITCPGGVTDECPLDGATGSATATDNCGSVTLTSSDQTVAACGGTGTTTRTFTATDGSGRTASCTQQIAVEDHTAPSISAPADKVLECNADTSPEATGAASSSDSCGSSSVASSDAETAGCGATRTITRTWTAGDACGNTSSATQTIQTVDTVAPTVAPPADAVVECGASTDPEQTGRAAGADSCGGVSVSSSDAFAAVCGGSGVLTRTWTVTDACGNPSSAAQAITVVDLTAPALVKPADATVECGGDTSPAATGSAAGSDVCGAVAVASADSETAACGATRAIHRAWTATDACGNETSGVQEIAVVDTTAPTITLAGSPAMLVECRGSFTDPGAGVTDACQGDLGAATVTGSVDVNVPGVYTLSYGAGDACGNTASATRVVTVSDTAAPTISCPASQVVSAGCGGSAGFTGATASDACGQATLVCSENGTPVGTEVGVGSHHIVCVATDQAGLTASCAFDVEVVATGADIFWRAPLADEPRDRDSDPQVQVFTSGQVLPVKIDVTGCDGADVTDAVSARVTVALDADGDGKYETALPGGGEMAHIGGKLQLDLDTDGYPAGTAGDGRSLLLTVTVLQGEAVLRSESLRLESR